MEYVYKEIRASKNSNSLLQYTQELESCCKNNKDCLDKLMKFTDEYGLEEVSRYLGKGVKEMEKSLLWMKAAISYLENM